MLCRATPVALAAHRRAADRACRNNEHRHGRHDPDGCVLRRVRQLSLASAGGAAWDWCFLGLLVIGLFFALFVVKFRSDEFIIGCALNTFALGLTTYLSRSVFGTSGAKGFPPLPTVTFRCWIKFPSSARCSTVTRCLCISPGSWSSCCGCSSIKPRTASGCARAAKARDAAHRRHRAGK